MLDLNIFNTPQIEQLYPYERLEDLVALLYDVNLKSKRGFSFDTSEAQLKLEHDSLLADLSANPSFQETLSNAIEAVKTAQIIMDSREAWTWPSPPDLKSRSDMFTDVIRLVRGYSSPDLPQ